MSIFSRKEYDFIAIGDTVTDAFIRLNIASAHVELDHGSGREICMRFGDKIPYDEVHVVAGVGNAANAAVSASRLGLKAAFVSHVGDDEQGKEILDVFKKEGVAGDFIKIHKGIPTNYHYVLWYKDERTILIKHQQYPYKLPDIGEPKWIYFSSLGENSLEFHEEIADYLEAHPDVKLAFQPGTFQMKFGKEKLKRIYARTDVFFCNKEEAQRILGADDGDIKNLLEGLSALGPKIVAITDGVKGAYVFDTSTALGEGGKMYFMPLYPDPKPPLQRTGAGDAFSSTVTAALGLGKNIQEALRWGPVNSMSVVQGIGARAGLLSRERLEEYLVKAPVDYSPKEI
ncbi:MAG: carbohydrate kinase family protein [Candidatus Sungbacteria bacterium]|nr:carbohydrate kinase family protein [Candidatus Sungbacteria bacterium]